MRLLSFSDSSLECRYQQYYRDVTAEYVRWAALIGALIVLGFAWQDPMISSNGYIATRIRFYGAIPVSIIVFYMTRLSRMRPWITWLNAFFWISYTCLIVAIFLVYEPGPFGLTSSIGLGSMFVIMFGIFALSNLPFLSSFAVGLICLLIYSGAVCRWTNVARQDFFAGDFLTVLVFVLGGTAKSLFEERARRRQFETSELLSEAYATVEHQVRERTAELESKNTQLALEMTERMEMTERLQASEYRFRVFFEKNADPIVIINPQALCLEDANAAALALLHCTRDEVIDKQIADFTPEFQPDGQRSRDLTMTFTKMTKEAGFCQFECLRQSPHRAPFPVEIVQTWIDDKKSPFILSTWRDISVRKQMEQQLFHSQKLESVGRLAGGVAHDFNNKLSVIMGYAELSRLELPEDSIVRGFLSEITRAAEFSRDITSKLLTFSRQQIISPRLVDLNVLIAESVRSLKHLISAVIRVEFLPGSDLWGVKMDPVQIDQIIINLAVNAADAMPDGGTLTIVTANSAAPEISGGASVYSSGEFVCISVKDEGAGMDDETVKHIFEPFFTTKAVGKGTGLGLSIIHGIVSQNKGFIDLESRLGTGTTFRVYLPRHLPLTGDDLATEVAVTQGCGSILLVEDDERVRCVTLALLERSGYQVVSCSSADEAVAYCIQAGEVPELILTDIVMPGMRVREMVEKLRAIRNDSKVIYMSGYAADMQDVAENSVGTAAIIQKPVTIQELHRKIVALMD